MKKIFLFATLITGLFSSIAVMAQKKKAVAAAPAPQVILAKDPIIKEQSFRLLGPFRGGRAAAGVDLGNKMDDCPRLFFVNLLK